MTEQGGPAEPTTSDDGVGVAKARGALTRYRVMAWVTGIMLLLLCLRMVLDYGLELDVPWLGWVPQAHGLVYMVYLVTTFDLWSRMRWQWARLVTMALAGVVPVMSFVLERRVHADAEARIGS